MCYTFYIYYMPMSFNSRESMPHRPLEPESLMDQTESSKKRRSKERSESTSNFVEGIQQQKEDLIKKSLELEIELANHTSTIAETISKIDSLESELEATARHAMLNPKTKQEAKFFDAQREKMKNLRHRALRKMGEEIVKSGTPAQPQGILQNKPETHPAAQGFFAKVKSFFGGNPSSEIPMDSVASMYAKKMDEMDEDIRNMGKNIKELMGMLQGPSKTLADKEMRSDADDEEWQRMKTREVKTQRENFGTRMTKLRQKENRDFALTQELDDMKRKMEEGQELPIQAIGNYGDMMDEAMEAERMMRPDLALKEKERARKSKQQRVAAEWDRIEMGNQIIPGNDDVSDEELRSEMKGLNLEERVDRQLALEIAHSEKADPSLINEMNAKDKNFFPDAAALWDKALRIAKAKNMSDPSQMATEYVTNVARIRAAERAKLSEKEMQRIRFLLKVNPLQGFMKEEQTKKDVSLQEGAPDYFEIPQEGAIVQTKSGKKVKTIGHRAISSDTIEVTVPTAYSGTNKKIGLKLKVPKKDFREWQVNP